jgi:Bacterial inner membrane protein
MGNFVEIFHENPLAAAFGAIGLMCQLIWPIFRARRAIITVQFGIGSHYSVQYALLGAWSGAGVAGLGALQSVLAFFAGERPWSRYAGFFFLPTVGAIGYATWNGLASVFALAAVTLIMVGRMQRDTLRLRFFLLAAAPFGISYDIAVSALPALVGGLVSAIIASTMLVREIRSRRQPIGPKSLAQKSLPNMIVLKGAFSNA